MSTNSAVGNMKNATGIGEWLLDDGWLAKKAGEVGVDGTVITSGGYNLDGWVEAVVPGTILSTLVRNGKYPDPYLYKNNTEIPDIFIKGRDFYTYWFCTEFELPASAKGKRVYLQFRGINYLANVFLNGAQVNNTSLQGMFLRHFLDITALANFGGNNRLAVIVYPVDHPGDVSKGGQGGDHQIAQDVTAQYVEGWDWMIPTPDRNTGIWDRASLHVSGPVTIRDPHVVTQLPDGARGRALITVSADLINGSGAAQTGTVTYMLEGHTLSQDFSLGPGETKTIASPSMSLSQPRLWWPNGYGSQELYEMDFSLDVTGYGFSDDASVCFGVREIQSYIDPDTQGRIFCVNGQRIFVRGGNWICSDGMLRNTAKRYRDEVRFHAEMNLNMIRIWGGSISERPEFYDACDEYGLLVMQEFWMTGDCNGLWGGEYTWPLDHQLYIDCAKDTVKMLRNHPSLCFWCGGNELDEQQPPNDIEAALTGTIMPDFDGMPDMPGTQRLYIPSSLSGGLGPRDGPYGIVATNEYYTMTLNRYAFNPELGSVGTPVVETLRRFLSPEALSKFPVDQDFGDEWRFHTYIPYSNISHSNSQEGCRDQVAIYGDPKTVDDFALQAQIVNYVQYRALYEGASKFMWTHKTGILVWKTHNPWTGLRGQLYDYYHDQTGGYFGVRKACEPVHIQLNWDDLCFAIVNCTSRKLERLTVQYTVHHYLNGQQIWKESKIVKQVDASTTYISPSTITIPKGDLPIYFIRMVLTDANGKLLSENLYWRSASDPEDFASFAKLKPISLDGIVRISMSGSDYVLEACMKNPAGCVAFAVRLKVINPNAPPGTENRVLPTLYDDNYFTLMPGEEKQVIMRCSQADAGNVEPQVWLEGYNVIKNRLNSG